ncbi:MAG: aminomethyl-transferring glycine dehydrogenase subunit GcvPA [Gammaproteobacteria bacterium]|jgi:glycine dehydrogenase subunit 1|nr:aminomethyl-transferring glycine dehydrogenase subunit GcvPA [Gammaproteobacteria bacterium]
MPFIPHTDQDKHEMLESIGAPNISALFDEIPAELIHQGLPKIPAGINEMTLLSLAQDYAERNKNDLCFIGAGAYDHHCPAAVWDIAMRGEFLTAYTPYQAEASQGTLQLLYEFQTMIAELTGLPVANASMYDGASALAEAALMAVRIQRHKQPKILVAGTLHPFYRDTLATILSNQHIELITLPFDSQLGLTAVTACEAYQDQKISALIIPQPNFFGCLEQVDELSDWAHHHQIISIACVNPTSLAILKPPGQWGKFGVDIACGEGQPLGVPMASGGPYFGFFSTRLEHVRQLPGRLIGQTLDRAGKIGYTLTLQAREQHIRRGKATSNICTNQGLLVAVATLYMSLLGPEGLAQTAQHCHHNTHSLVEAMQTIPGVELVFSAPYFHEALLRLPYPAADILTAMHEQGIAAGYPVDEHYPNLHNTILVCATEKRTAADIERYVSALHLAIKSQGTL